MVQPRLQDTLSLLIEETHRNVGAEVDHCANWNFPRKGRPIRSRNMNFFFFSENKLYPLVESIDLFVVEHPGFPIDLPSPSWKFPKIFYFFALIPLKIHVFFLNLACPLEFPLMSSTKVCGFSFWRSPMGKRYQFINKKNIHCPFFFLLICRSQLD